MTLDYGHIFDENAEEKVEEEELDSSNAGIGFNFDKENFDMVMLKSLGFE